MKMTGSEMKKTASHSSRLSGRITKSVCTVVSDFRHYGRRAESAGM